MHSYSTATEQDEWRKIRVTMTEIDRDFDYYLDLVERENKIVVITREGKDFAYLLPTKNTGNEDD